jgi:23S rRNA pseudouridine2604 synthase
MGPLRLYKRSKARPAAQTAKSIVQPGPSAALTPPSRSIAQEAETVRINKFFTRQGMCSRREADVWIEKGRVAINGRVAVLGDRVTRGDVVTLDGTIVAWGNVPIYIKYHKPIGITTTSEPHVAGNIIAAIGHMERIFPIGRLDKDSSGLILLTNDGEIVNEILRAEHRHEKEYVVDVDRPFDQGFLNHMARGVDILGKITRPCVIRRTTPRRFRIILTEGRNRQIRRMCQALGYRVTALHRIRIMNVLIGDLPVGQWRNLSEREQMDLFLALGRMSPQQDDRQ